MSDSLDSVFYLSIATLIVGVCGLSIRYCYRSKCEDLICCWGLLKIHRNTAQEEGIGTQYSNLNDV